tara:strand:- start:434 stop:577 length:144 start_codon:yes stop_codon:yes gene_type:complete
MFKIYLITIFLLLISCQTDGPTKKIKDKKQNTIKFKVLTDTKLKTNK